MKLLDRTAGKFLLVGIANTLFGTAVMFLSYNLLHFNYWVSSAANYVLGSILSYFLNKHFTFQNREKGWRVIVRFIVNIAVCYFLAYGIAQPLVSLLFANADAVLRDNLAMLCGMGFFVVFNYFGQRFFAFRAASQSGNEQKEE